ncbi:GCIP domain-containing protein [Cephalotus follicularis]|uniref:GCIP domain-containing protein n=1 Tax=Cephalotus follicularis TaxID=3775 RepID=A0A1Q3C5L0_CEPFO|nr:GCIP domain-containing protein [Cephalotus follicularis]
MGKAEKQHLSQVLNSHLNTIHDTFQILDQTPPPNLKKVNWNEVIQMGDQVSKQATIAGMLWTGEVPEAKAIEENIESYFNMLQGFLLLSHGSTVGAGPTLSSNIHGSIKQVVNSSFKLLKESVSLYGSRNKDKTLSIPHLVGAVWEACTALKKVPSTNITAIGRAMTQVAVSVKDVLREMKELKPCSSRPGEEASNDVSVKAESGPHDYDDDDTNEDDLGNVLSAEEMIVAQSAIGVVSETLVVIKELIRTITGMLKLENPDNSSSFVDSLEKLLKLCQGIGEQIDELGACVYPEQDIPAMKAASEKILKITREIQVEVESFNGSSDAFHQSCSSLRSSLKQMDFELDRSSTTDLVTQMDNVAFSN